MYFFIYLFTYWKDFWGEHKVKTDRIMKIKNEILDSRIKEFGILAFIIIISKKTKRKENAIKNIKLEMMSWPCVKVISNNLNILWQGKFSCHVVWLSRNLWMNNTWNS